MESITAQMHLGNGAKQVAFVLTAFVHDLKIVIQLLP